MKTLIKGGLLGVGLLIAAAVTMTTEPVNSQEPGIQSLRGHLMLNEEGEAGELKNLNTGQLLERAYRQQPPLIPHKIDKYQINLKVNQCLHCHDWPYNVQENAPKVSETHYIDRNGVALNKVTNGRWFCTQCHVPQIQARALIPNTFRSAFDE